MYDPSCWPVIAHVQPLHVICLRQGRGIGDEAREDAGNLVSVAALRVPQEGAAVPEFLAALNPDFAHIHRSVRRGLAGTPATPFVHRSFQNDEWMKLIVSEQLGYFILFTYCLTEENAEENAFHLTQFQ